MKTQKGIECLVIAFKNKILDQMHQDIKDKHKVRPFFHNYAQHITLSYDCGDVDLDKVKLADYIHEINLVSDYQEENTVNL